MAEQETTVRRRKVRAFLVVMVMGVVVFAVLWAFLDQDSVAYRVIGLGVFATMVGVLHRWHALIDGESGPTGS